ncbi:MAG: protein translocase subunit SecF [Pseudomonadota bacterium]
MLKNTNIQFVKYRYVFMAISIFLFVASIFVIWTKGFNYGIDFEGGAKLAYQFVQPVSEGEVRRALSDTPYAGASVIRFGEKKENRISIKISLPEEHARIGETITATLVKSFGQGQVELEKEEAVGPKVGKEMRKKAILTIIFSWAMMLIYIGYRFDFLFSPGAVLSLIHDTIITMGIFALLGKEVDLTILAAILTLIGFSINDTIVVYDRIRENKSRVSSTTIKNVVNEAINSTLSRTMITSLTLLFVVVVLFFKGGGTLHNFAFMMIVGVIIGTYSSVFIAAPIYIGLYDLWPDIRKLWVKK